MVVAAAVASPSVATAQPGSLPDGPAKDGFDFTRFSTVGNGVFETFHVERTEPLATALQDGRVTATAVETSGRSWHTATG